MATLSSPDAADLLINVRNMLNQPSATNSSWTDDELLVYLNEAIRRYFSECVQHMGGQFVTSVSLDIVSGTETVACPSDFFSVRTLYRTVAGGYEALVYKNDVTTGYDTGQSGGSGYLPSYYLRRNNLVLRPSPGFSETGGLLLEYVAFPTTMLTGGDSLTADVSPVFRDLIEAYAVYKAKVKESLVSGVNTSAVIKDNLNDLYTVFKDALNKRSACPTFVQPFNVEEF